MEAVSRGTAEAGGHVIGVTCDEIEAWRPVIPNSWIMEEWRYSTIQARLYALVENCDATITLPGGIGTLAEVAAMWSQLQTGVSRPKPLILVGEGWATTISTFYRNLGEYVAERDRRWVHLEMDIVSAFQYLKSMIGTLS